MTSSEIEWGGQRALPESAVSQEPSIQNTHDAKEAPLGWRVLNPFNMSGLLTLDWQGAQ